ncbi:MAG: hypothetical protein ACFFE6_13800, partial [Candidatus Thorarchaeota archaeon]
VQSAEWLTYAASEIARIVDAPNHIPELHNLKSRLRYGVQTDILELVSLRGVGRIRGRMLHNYGLTNLADLYRIPITELASIPTIGSSIAESIKQQLGIDVKTGTTRVEESQEMNDDVDSIQTLLEDFSN